MKRGCGSQAPKRVNRVTARLAANSRSGSGKKIDLIPAMIKIKDKNIPQEDLRLNKKNLLKVPIVVLFIGLIFLWVPVFMNYYGLMEADWLTSNLSFENADLEICPLGPKFPLLFWGTIFYSFQLVLNFLSEAIQRLQACFYRSELLCLRC
jgi:hypothetical protein